MSKTKKTDDAYHAHKKLKAMYKQWNLGEQLHESTNPLFYAVRTSGIRHGNNRQYYAKRKVYIRKVDRLKSKQEIVFETTLLLS